MGRNDSLVEGEISGEKNVITVNYRYFLEGVVSVDSPYVTIKMIDSTNPCVIVPGDDRAAGEFLYIVMPIKQ